MSAHFLLIVPYSQVMKWALHPDHAWADLGEQMFAQGRAFSCVGAELGLKSMSHHALPAHTIALMGLARPLAAPVLVMMQICHR
ncbi:MAG: hypothetical protein E6J34_22480 [Chloroflexi bacterium]|nr:MAG: hypothetical protein E6J34_22480 [Chloroflexota bacterium]